MEEGTVAFSINRNDIWKIGTLTVSPFDWLEASYFYYRPSDLKWIDGVPGHDLDKGFNVKATYKTKNKYLPNFSVGLDDFAGTGYFSREYIVSTLEFLNMNISTGIGWGKFLGQNSFKNPLNYISEDFKTRPRKDFSRDFGGTPTYNQWFKGDATIFGGVEFYLNRKRNIRFKLEYDPFDYTDFSALKRDDLSFERRKKDSNLNFGISIPYNKFLNLEASFIKGNTFNLSLTYSLAFNESLSNKNKFNPVIEKYTKETNDKRAFYDDLLFNLNSNQLFLQTANLDNKELNIAISSSEHRNSIRSASYAAYISNKVADINDFDLNKINITKINAGIELNKISFVPNHLDDVSNVPREVKIMNTKIDSGEPDSFLSNEYRPIVNFPIIFSSFQPRIKSHIGVPEKFYFGGVYLQHISEIQFNRNLILTSEVDYSIYNNFRDTITGPASKLPHVRTDVIQYLKKEGILLSRLQLDYIWSPKKELYAKISGGIFETMYGGLGTQFLYKPFAKNYSMSLDAFYVKRRSFDQRFNFLEYETATGHLNFTYYFPFGIESNISVGRYLAKDIGYTFDLSRSTKSGFKSGFYFTRTDVPKEIFGEGSFDKGFYFQFPLDLFSNNYNNKYSTFKLSPLTRDGGAKLLFEKDLRGMIYNSSFRELSNQYKGYLD